MLIQRRSTQYRKIITEGDIGDPTPEFPANPAFALPVVQPTGIFERLNNLVERIRVAPNYTAETGALLGIIPSDERINRARRCQTDDSRFCRADGLRIFRRRRKTREIRQLERRDSPRRSGKMGNRQNRNRQIGQRRHHADHARQTRTASSPRAVVKKQRKLRSARPTSFPSPSIRNIKGAREFINSRTRINLSVRSSPAYSLFKIKTVLNMVSVALATI